jgi:hypothetical protein
MCGFDPLTTNTVTVTLRKNGADTAMTLTIPAGSVRGAIVADAAHTASFAVGDKISVKLRQSGAAVQSSWFGLFQVG